MKKIKDFIYDYNDIVVILLIIALAAAIILWRVDGIMAYSSYLESKTEQSQKIDIDFGDIDLNPIEDDPVEEDETVEPEEEDPSPEIVNPTPDKGFISTREVTVVIPKGANSAKIAGVTADAYGYTNDDYKNFVTAFTEVAKELNLEVKMYYGTYKIPSGSSLEDIINQFAHK